MYVRLAFAVAAHLEPEILIVDEVLAVGDAAFQKKCLGKMEKRRRRSDRAVRQPQHVGNSASLLEGRADAQRQGVFADGQPGRDRRSSTLPTRDSAENPDISKWEDRQGYRRSAVGAAPGRRFQGQAQHDGSRWAIRSSSSWSSTSKEPADGSALRGWCLHSATGEPMVDLQAAHSGLKSGRLQGRSARWPGRRYPISPLYPGRYLLSPWVTDSASHGFIDLARFLLGDRHLSRARQVRGPHPRSQVGTLPRIVGMEHRSDPSGG